MHPDDPCVPARKWLVVGEQLGTEDRLTVEAAAHFATQLPELLRGVYYEGWTPAHPLRRPGVCRPGGHPLDRGPRGRSWLCSPGRLGDVMKLLPSRLVELLTGGGRAS
ncbi:DUF2267 domain-containing protein [Amycolatopsis eburnea]|uniref:DUF2267 domain-containing protein n=1 Tax=Amycolatopsis eburnea TaxID=2267691 RepID=A0A3R9EMJ4_9PSEU|nr:DUF2267 domain-containing protein [Amycolatopsis eburnea]RSD11633.1 DUF2267 domain-containing protein [Amycolatopsis eburnea]